ncbi:hypothetical protein P7K49_027221, partial [Saguinus oedipus]
MWKQLTGPRRTEEACPQQAVCGQSRALTCLRDSHRQDEAKTESCDLHLLGAAESDAREEKPGKWGLHRK